MSNLSKKNLTEIVKLIKKKEIKSEELTQSFVKNINNDKKLNLLHQLLMPPLNLEKMK